MNINRIAEKLAASKSTLEHIRCVQSCRVGAGGEEEFLCSVRDRIKPLWLRRAQCENGEVIEKFKRERRRLAAVKPLKHSIQSVLESSPSTSAAAMASTTFIQEKTPSSNASTSASEEEEELICVDAKLSNADGGLIYTFQRANGDRFSLPSDEVYSRGKVYVKKAISTMFKKYYNTTVEFNPLMGVILTPSPTMKDITAEMFLKSQKEWKAMTEKDQPVEKDLPKENEKIEDQNESGFEETGSKSDAELKNEDNSSDVNTTPQNIQSPSEENKAKPSVPEIVITSEADNEALENISVKSESRSPTVLEPADSQPDEFKLQTADCVLTESQNADLSSALSDECASKSREEPLEVSESVSPAAVAATSPERQRSLPEVDYSDSEFSDDVFLSDEEQIAEVCAAANRARNTPMQPEKWSETTEEIPEVKVKEPNVSTAQSDASTCRPAAEAPVKPKRKVGRPRKSERSPRPPKSPVAVEDQPKAKEVDGQPRDQRRSKIRAINRICEVRPKLLSEEEEIVPRKVGRPRTRPAQPAPPADEQKVPKRSGRPRKHPLQMGPQFTYGKTGRPNKEAMARMKRIKAHKEKIVEKLGSGVFDINAIPVDLLSSPKKKLQNAEEDIKEEIEEVIEIKEEEISDHSTTEESQNSTKSKTSKTKKRHLPEAKELTNSQSSSSPTKSTPRRSITAKSASPEKPSASPPKSVTTSAEPSAKRRRLH